MSDVSALPHTDMKLLLLCLAAVQIVCQPLWYQQWCGTLAVQRQPQPLLLLQAGFKPSTGCVMRCAFGACITALC